MPVTSLKTSSLMLSSKVVRVVVGFPYAMRNDGIVRAKPRNRARISSSTIVFFFSSAFRRISSVAFLVSSLVFSSTLPTSSCFRVSVIFCFATSYLALASETADSLFAAAAISLKYSTVASACLISACFLTISTSRARVLALCFTTCSA
ncbi:hypothetical protein SDC9_127468 [bioreactor metagenome]|uniref:Uncharacterized protein n=1 Tax=bioreactor metagenome TaxID=1076179 RepID=A0A645CU39_9ZZZZ